MIFCTLVAMAAVVFLLREGVGARSAALGRFSLCDPHPHQPILSCNDVPPSISAVLIKASPPCVHVCRVGAGWQQVGPTQTLHHLLMQPVLSQGHCPQPSSRGGADSSIVHRPLRSGSVCYGSAIHFTGPFVCLDLMPFLRRASEFFSLAAGRI